MRSLLSVISRHAGATNSLFINAYALQRRLWPRPWGPSDRNGLIQAFIDRPQTGGYSICETAIPGTQRASNLPTVCLHASRPNLTG